MSYKFITVDASVNRTFDFAPFLLEKAHFFAAFRRFLIKNQPFERSAGEGIVHAASCDCPAEHPFVRTGGGFRIGLKHERI